MATISRTYVLTLTTDDTCDPDDAVRRAVAHLAVDVDPSRTSPVRLSLSDADGGELAAYSYDPWYDA